MGRPDLTNERRMRENRGTDAVQESGQDVPSPMGKKFGEGALPLPKNFLLVFRLPMVCIGEL